MSRSRNIKPAFFLNEDLAECDPLARLLFVALWCQADREGRLEDRPKRIKAAGLPYDDCDVNALLDQLCSAGFIVRYTVDAKDFIAIPEFPTHQNPHCKEAVSTIPAPDEHHTSKVRAPEKHSTSPADSLLLIPDSPNPPKAESPPDGGDGAGFAEFWEAYPNKTGKKPCRERWKQKRLGRIAAQIVADVKRRKAEHGKWLDGFIPNPLTYLNQERWNDPIARAPPKQFGKRVEAFLALEDVKRGLVEARDCNGPSKADLPRLGGPAGERADRGHAGGVGGGGDCGQDV